jgi:hypothetical protein
MKLPPHTFDIVDQYGDTSAKLPACSWCGQPARFRFYAGGRGVRQFGCLLDFLVHRESGDTWAQLLVLTTEDKQQVEADLEAIEVQSVATDVDVFLYELEVGFFDEDLDRIVEQAKSRLDLRARALASTFRNGDRVKVVGDIRPTWLQNQVGKIKSHKSDKFIIEMETPPNRTFTIPAIYLRPFAKEAAA